MRHKLFQLASAVLILTAAAASARADLRIKQRMSVSGQSMESEVAIKGQRQRTEQQIGPGMKSVTVMQCDLKRMLNIGEATRKYTVTPLGGDADGGAETSAPAASPTRPAPTAARRGGVVTYVMTMTDTGERKQMLGFTVRRIKTVTKSEASPDACQKDTVHYETDGWYVDFEFNFSCLTESQGGGASYAGARPECQDRVRYRRAGTAKLGYPVHLTSTFYKDGQPQFVSTTEVLSIERATLDAALFDVPAGYTEARDARELYDVSAMMAAAQAGAGGDDDNADAGGRTGAGAAATATAAPASVGAKRAGVVRIGVIPPSNKSDKSVGIDALRAGLIANLTGANVEAVALEATSPGGLEAEAKSKECDFLLYTDFVSVKQSAASKIGGFMSRATGAGAGSEKYEARIEFSLVAAGSSAPLLEANAAAKEDGSPDAALAAALRREAQTVLAKVRK
ncbi:MAG: DUF4412 domain-containing protein [Acidobacteria bacterium]|nr:DUF4412 domain-containing protein [Acidobacteriota bacterium]